MIDSASDYTAQIRALVGEHRLGYYFNPGGCEFFSPAHPLLPHCQTSGGYDDKEDWERLVAWVETHRATLVLPGEPNHLWCSEGSWPVRCINGRYFHRCTLSCEVAGEDVKPEEWQQEFVDVRELPDGTGWELLCADRSGRARDDLVEVWVTIKCDTPEARAEFEQMIFKDHP